MDHHFRGKPPEIRALFDAVVAMVQTIGPVRVLSEKARRLEHPRFRRIETFSPRSHMHVFRLAGEGDLLAAGGATSKRDEPVARREGLDASPRAKQFFEELGSKSRYAVLETGETIH